MMQQRKTLNETGLPWCGAGIRTRVPEWFPAGRVGAGKRLTLGFSALALAMAVQADKICPGGSCSVPENADCNFYAETIVTSPQSGDEEVYDNVLIFTFKAKNCNEYTQPQSGTLRHTVTWKKSVNLSLTGTAGASGEVKSAASAGPLASAEATAGLTTSISTTSGGSTSTTTTDSAAWKYTVAACEKKSAQLLGNWKEGNWDKSAWVRAFYYLEGSSGSIQETSCWKVDATSSGTSKYYSWEISALPDEICSPCSSTFGGGALR